MRAFCVQNALAYQEVLKLAVMMSAEHTSKVPAWCDCTDAGSNHAAAWGGRKIIAAPSVEEIRALLRNNKLKKHFDFFRTWHCSLLRSLRKRPNAGKGIVHDAVVQVLVLVPVVQLLGVVSVRPDAVVVVHDRVGRQDDGRRTLDRPSERLLVRRRRRRRRWRHRLRLGLVWTEVRRVELQLGGASGFFRGPRFSARARAWVLLGANLNL